MKLYRYMSYFEFSGLARGGILRNTTDHRIKRGSATTARGFCFGIGDEAQAKKDIRRLRGIVNTEILIVFTPKDSKKFTPCRGRYIDYDKIDAEGKTVEDYPIRETPNRFFDEYCTESYSLDDIAQIETLKRSPLPPFIVNFK